MSSPTVITIALILLAVVVLRLLVSKRRQSAPFPYKKSPALFSPAERSFFGVLEQAVGVHYYVFGKVRIADVVETTRGLSGSHRQSAFNRINAKHFDFLLCDKQDLSVVCAIELDDRSHTRSSRQQRDAFVTELCHKVDLPLLRVRASRSYSLSELRENILQATQRRMEPTISTADVSPSSVAPS